MKNITFKYYKKDGTPYPLGNKGFLEFARDLENKDHRRVGYKKLWWGGRVSTVWLGIDHSFLPSSKPLVFETMVFPPFSYRELDIERYSTEEEAIEGHKRMVAKWFTPFELITRWFK